MILADTSVWVDHARRGNAALARLLEAGQIATHPFVVGELACGNPPRRTEFLARLGLLPTTAVALHEEVLALVERHRLMGLGVGWIDAHLIASARLANLRLWSLDQRALLAADRLGVATTVA